MNLVIHTEDHVHKDHDCEEDHISPLIDIPWNIYSSENLNIVELNQIDPLIFNAILLKLDARHDSLMKWTYEMELAKCASERGLNIIWNLDLGLFESFEQLFDTGVFHSSELALKHFLKEVYPFFKPNTIGVILYDGPLNFIQFSNIEEAVNEYMESYQGSFCNSLAKKIIARDLALDIVDQLAALLPAELMCFLKLSQESLTPYESAHLVSKEAFSLYHLIVDSPWLAQSVNALGIDCVTKKGFISRKQPFGNAIESTIGLLLPNSEALLQSSLESFLPIDLLREKSCAFRIVSEVFLTHEWNGIDYLIVDSSFMTAQCRRKLLGFIAAGGVVVSSDKPIDLPDEVSWSDFFQNLS